MEAWTRRALFVLALAGVTAGAAYSPWPWAAPIVAGLVLMRVAVALSAVARQDQLKREAAKTLAERTAKVQTAPTAKPPHTCKPTPKAQEVPT